MLVKGLCSSAAVWAVLVGSAFAMQPGEQWLQRLQTAQATQSYQGAFIYERKGAFTTHQISRQISPDGQVIERFAQLSGPEHEVLRVDGQVACISSDATEPLAVEPVWPIVNLEAQHLQEQYKVIELGETRVAGRMVSVLLFSPFDQYRYPVEIYVDQATYVPLKTLLLNEQGQLLERLQFVQFQEGSDLLPVDAELEQIVPNAKCATATATATQPTATAKLDVDVDWAVAWLPDGFTLVKSQYRQSPDSGNFVLSRMYSDGLASFSVFFESIDNLDIDGSRRQLGPTAVVSRKVEQGVGALMVTVVGEIPIATAERIALSAEVEQEYSDD